MSDSTLSIRLAQAMGLTTTSAIAGVSFSISAFVVPRILESPSPLLLRQWKHTYEAGKASIPTLAALCSVSFYYLAYEAKQAPNSLPQKWRVYLFAGLLTASIAPYTYLFMAPTNKKLLEKAAETSTLAEDDKIVEIGLGGESAHQLVDKWASLNVGRSFMLAAAAIISTWTTLGSTVPS